MIQALGIVFIGVTVIQILIWLLFPARFIWAGGIQRVKVVEISDLQPVSVIICARNEAENLQRFLPWILQQDYPAAWEVIVVDDDSQDDTASILKNLARKYPQLRVIRISPKLHPGKKHALSTGLQAARFEWIALTDADCRPSGIEWLKTMMRQAYKPGVILGYAPLYTVSGWLNRWARMETLYTALQYLSTTYAGWPFMGVGRNLVWHKSLFIQAGGFAAHAHIAGGDDDLFINAVANQDNAFICIAPETWMYSSAKMTLKSWVRQKKRHLHAGLGYKTWHNFILGGVAFTHAVHYGFGLILFIIAPQYRMLVLAGYLLRLLVVWLLMHKSCRLLGEQHISPFIPVLDGLLAVWLGVIAPFLLVSGNKKPDWK
jgi:poly-beta-1,6-N-acetyl-D-glucosamine synthase